MATDLAVNSFFRLRQTFFDSKGRSKPFMLREKRNTQDDPLDEYLADVVLSGLDGITCVKSPGPLISPDMVLLRGRAGGQLKRQHVAGDTTDVMAIEVKKLERGSNGVVARASGLDYNTTPPCGVVKVYDDAGTDFLVRGFYLFVCLEDENDNLTVTGLALTDGFLLNSDVDLYLSIVGQRSKEIGLGSFGDGVNRNRPMMIFSNPLGVPQLDNTATLVHSDHSLSGDGLVKVGTIKRTAVSGEPALFSCYRLDADAKPKLGDLEDPFPVPQRRKATQGRGKFVVPVRVV